MVAVFCLITGCQSSEDTASDIQLEWEITPNPPSVGEATLSITLRDSLNQLLTGADVNIEGNMSHPGMQPVLAEAEEIDPGVYSAPIQFTMGGDWFFIIKSTLPDNRALERQINVNGVSSEE
jgi:hypothetical protein